MAFSLVCDLEILLVSVKGEYWVYDWVFLLVFAKAPCSVFDSDISLVFAKVLCSVYDWVFSSVFVLVPCSVYDSDISLVFVMEPWSASGKVSSSEPSSVWPLLGALSVSLSFLNLGMQYEAYLDGTSGVSKAFSRA